MELRGQRVGSFDQEIGALQRYVRINVHIGMHAEAPADALPRDAHTNVCRGMLI